MEGPDFVEKRLKPLKPDVLIWGPGPWVPIVHKDRENAKAFLQAMKAAVAPRMTPVASTTRRSSALTRRSASESEGSPSTMLVKT